MPRRWTLKYGSAAILTGAVIIAASLLANPAMLPRTGFAAASFAVMLTDPPTVPTGTTVLNLTYSDVLLHVSYPNGTVEWLTVPASGTVDLFSLVNMTQTIASTTIPVGSTVDKIQLTIADVDAVVGGVTYNVTALSDTLVIKVAEGQVNQTLSGVLLDFNPTLVQIQATDADGALVNYYVLVPSATAVVVNDLDEGQLRVGTIVRIGENNRVRLVRVGQEFKSNVAFVSASLSVAGNATTLSVTLRNGGSFPFRVFGLTLHGEFNVTQTLKTHHYNGHGEHNVDERIVERIRFGTIPFKVSSPYLVPLLGDQRYNRQDDEHEDIQFSLLALQPGESVTLSFSGVIALHPWLNTKYPVTAITPIVGRSYTLRLMGEGFQTLDVTANS